MGRKIEMKYEKPKIVNYRDCSLSKNCSSKNFCIFVNFGLRIKKVQNIMKI